jgi:sporulation protein YlmC with PRC-barrel domain
MVLGEVKGVQLNTSAWKVTTLVIKLSSQSAEKLGFKKRFGSPMVCMPVSLITAVGDVITIDKSLEELSKNPEMSECRE